MLLTWLLFCVSKAVSQKINNNRQKGKGRSHWDKQGLFMVECYATLKTLEIANTVILMIDEDIKKSNLNCCEFGLKSSTQSQKPQCQEKSRKTNKTPFSMKTNKSEVGHTHDLKFCSEIRARFHLLLYSPHHMTFHFDAIWLEDFFSLLRDDPIHEGKQDGFARIQIQDLQ